MDPVEGPRAVLRFGGAASATLWVRPRDQYSRSPSRGACLQVGRANLAVETLPPSTRPAKVPSAPDQDETKVHAMPVQLSIQLDGN
ncbi:hypothetical protein EES40_09580 [Streptomyces sp. ADI93-02]|nr:hypothetical protein EES40_09580 [Streptomyces sp. ADI93-02]